MRDGLSGGIDNARMKSDLLDASLKRMAATVGTAFTLTKAIEFGKVMMDVRGQIESFQISFETLIGSKDKANAFFGELKAFATDTPLMLDDLARNAQTFLGFGIETEKVIPILKQIGDVTMGNKDRFNAMSLAFAQMHTAGKLMGQDLLQMINAGFNPLKTISEQTGKSIGKLRDEMSEGAISAEMVAQAFADVTGEGGKFNGMLAKQSEGWNGMKAQFQGAVQDMLNEMGTTSQGIMTAGMQTATSLVKNYETVGKVLVGLIATYGTYKAAVIAVAVAEKAKTLIALESALASRSLTVVEGLHAVVLKKVQMAQALLNKTMLANPYVAVAVGVVALVAAMWALSDSTSAEEKAQKKLNDTLGAAKKNKEDLVGMGNSLIDIINDETKTIYEQVEAWKDLQDAIPEAFKGMSMEEFKKLSPADAKKRMKEVAEERYEKDREKAYADQEKAVEALREKIRNKENGSGSRTAMGKSQIAKMKRELEAEEKALASIKNELDEIEEIKKKANETPVFSNVNDEIKKASEKVNELKKQLADLRSGKAQSTNYADDIEKTAEALDKAEKKLASLTGKDKKTEKKELTDKEKANILEADKKAREKQIQEYTASLVAQQKQSEFDIRQARIDAMKEGIDKEKAQIGLNYDKLIEENRQREEKWVKDLQVKTNLEYENKNPDWKKKGLSGPDQQTKENLSQEQKTLLEDYKKQADEYLADQSKKIIENEKKTYSRLLIEYGNYQQKKKGLSDSWEIEIAKLPEELRVNARKQRDREIAEVDADFVEKSQLWKQFFNDAEQLSLKETRRIGNSLREMIMKIADPEVKRELLKMLDEVSRKAEENANAIERMFGNSKGAGVANLFFGEGDFKSKIQAFSTTFKGAESASAGMAANASKASASMQGAGKGAGNTIAIIDAIIKGVHGTIQGIREVVSYFEEYEKAVNGSVSKTTEEWAGALETLGEFDEKVFSGWEKLKNGDVIGAVTDNIIAWHKLFTRGSVQAAKNAELTKEMTNKTYIAEKEVNRLYRERYDWSKRIGETNLEYTRRMGEELAKQHAASSQDAEDYWAKLMGSTYKNEWDDGKRTGIFGWDWTAKDVDAGWTGDASLAGMTADELEVLYQQGRLNAEAEEYYLKWKQANEEQQDFMQKELEEAERLREMVTGTSFSSIADSIVEGFKAGKRSAADFAETFEDLMRNAVAAALSVSADDKLRQWYEDFAKASDSDGDGINDLTQEEIEALRKRYSEIVGELDQERQNLESATGTSIRTVSQSGKAGAYETASQDSITRLEGLYSSMLENEIGINNGVENIVEGMNAALTHLQRIEENTAFCRRLNDIANDINAIKRDGIRTR
jgi:tape measure domain-containing protein